MNLTITDTDYNAMESKLSDQGQALIVSSYVGATVSTDDLAQNFDADDLKVITEHFSSNNNEKENDMNNLISRTTTWIDEQLQMVNKTDERVAFYNSRKYKKVDLADLLVQTEVQYLLALRRINELEQVTQPTQQQQQANTQSARQDCDHGDILRLLNRIGWWATLSENQKNWVARHKDAMRLTRLDDHAFLLSWAPDIYHARKPMCKSVMREWLTCAWLSGVVASRKPTGLRIVFG